jgi:hypothetical protein
MEADMRQARAMKAISGNNPSRSRRRARSRVPLLLIALLLAPIAVPVLWFAAGRGRRRWAVMAGPVLFYLLCALRGFKFEAGNAEDGVSMTIY